MKTIIIAILSFLAIYNVYCQNSSIQSLQLHVTTDKEIYHVGDEIIFTINFSNRDSQHLFFYFPNYEDLGYSGLVFADFVKVLDS